MLIRDIIKIYSEKLNYISDTPRLDVELLLLKALNKEDRVYIHMNVDKNLNVKSKKVFEKLISQRIDGRPVAYILNNREFMGIDFFVKEGVLIPRPDTETLVEKLIDIYNDRKNIKILEIGSGSGAICISLAKYLDVENVTSLDISDDALKISKYNARKNGVIDKIDFIKSNLFSAIANSNQKFDIIVSNPPYIRKSDIENLDTQVKDYEPKLALDGGEDGLDFYRKITEESKRYLGENGIVAYEVGHDQADYVVQILKKNNFKNILKFKDIQNIDRVVIGYNM